MGVITAAFDGSTKLVGGVAKGVTNKVKNAMATNRLDDVIDPEKGVGAKVVGAAFDVANVVSLNALRTTVNAVKKEYDYKAVKGMDSSATVQERVEKYAQSDKGKESTVTRVNELLDLADIKEEDLDFSEPGGP